jgi:hypothetical protein
MRTVPVWEIVVQDPDHSRSFPKALPRSLPVAAQPPEVTVPFSFSRSDAFVCGLVVVSLAPMFVRELLRSSRAGQVRFRLPLASKAGAEVNPTWTMTAGSWILLIIGVLVVVLFGRAGDLPAALICGTSAASAVVRIPWHHGRRDRLLWAGWVTAGLALAGGAGLVAFGVLALNPQFAPPKSALFGPPAVIIFGALFGLLGVYQIVEMLRGTVLREGGVVLFGLIRLWQEVAVDGWSPDEGGGFLLKLKISSPKVFALQVYPREAMVVPVAAADRPAIEAFLASHTARSPAPTAVAS